MYTYANYKQINFLKYQPKVKRHKSNKDYELDDTKFESLFSWKKNSRKNSQAKRK